ncbi:MAG TPA: ABC transporter substrate-binding protein [Candidatus Acidoferrales bacterium]|nr:ABC transporter substrate-binding protein [Candidatus Acidoferrales bacterium]
MQGKLARARSARPPGGETARGIVEGVQAQGGGRRTRWPALIVCAIIFFPAGGWPQTKLDRINISHSAISGSQAVLWVIQDAGVFKKHGLEAQIVYVEGGPPNIAALLAGDVDFTVFAGPSSIAANLGGADVAVLMSFINTMEHTVFSNPQIKRPADLKGKRIGVNRPGSADDYGARVALKKWGLEPDREVAMLSVGGQPSRLAAVQSGRVDATLLQPPFTIKARDAGLHELASLADLKLDYLGTCLVTTRARIQRNENLVRRFVKAFVEGIHFYKTQKEASLRSIAKFTKLKEAAALEEAYQTYALKFMERVPYPAIKGVEAILEDLAKTNPKARAADPKSFVEPRFLKELEDSGFIAQLYGKS